MLVLTEGDYFIFYFFDRHLSCEVFAKYNHFYGPLSKLLKIVVWDVAIKVCGESNHVFRGYINTVMRVKKQCTNQYAYIRT